MRQVDLSHGLERALIDSLAWVFFSASRLFPQRLCPVLGGGKGCAGFFFRRPASSPASAVFMEASALTCKALPGRQAGHIRCIPDARNFLTPGLRCNNRRGNKNHNFHARIDASSFTPASRIAGSAKVRACRTGPSKGRHKLEGKGTFLQHLNQVDGIKAGKGSPQAPGVRGRNGGGAGVGLGGLPA